MITKNELNEYSQLKGYNLGQTETDYLQHLFLIFLSRYSANAVVFKGGTALQKAYGLNRFSIDLDFAQNQEDKLPEIMARIGKGITEFGYAAKLEEIKTVGKTFILKINGPLYANVDRSVCSLKIEISKREEIILKPKLKTITPTYPDLQPYTMLIMDEEEILAEKVRAIMTRNKPRDIFDLNFLLNKGIKFNIELIGKKLAYYKEEYDKKKFIVKIVEKKNLWEKELKNFVPNVPDFDAVLKDISKVIE